MTKENETDAAQEERLYAYGATEETKTKYVPSIIWNYLQHVITSWNLPIGGVFQQLLDPKPFFLIAATGLGKTFTVPLWLLYRHMHYADLRPPLAEGKKRLAAESPRVWVVEPAIAICQDLEAELNGDWLSWLKSNATEPHLPLFGCKTRADNLHVDAPIMFITTGIFAIYARKQMFKSGRDTVLIDEAHKTLESDESVELGVAICRARKVHVNYMSATVDPAGLEKALGVRIERAEGKRQHIWRHNMKRSLEDCIVDLVRKTLVEQDRASEYFPPADTPHAEEIVRTVFEQDRAKGLLILVNSYAGENSEAKRIERLLREKFSGQPFEIGLLAGETRRIRQKKIAYKQMIERWKEQKKRYVLIATSVVEMGVTLPSLDYMVTSDEDFEGEPLRINSLIQRMGRVGRERPGIAYIVREASASYSDLDDVALNAPGALAPEQIRFPMKDGHLTGLAHLTLQWNWSELVHESQLTGVLPVPSFAGEAGAELFVRYNAEYVRLVRFGVGTQDPPGLTPDGILMERWIGRADLGEAMKAQRAYQSGDAGRLYSALCLCARYSVSEHDIFGILQDEPARANELLNELVRLCRLIVNHVYGRRYTSVHQQQEIADQVMEFLSVNDGRWMAFARYVAALAEACELFRRINQTSAADHEDTKLITLTDAWQRTLIKFLESPFG